MEAIGDVDIMAGDFNARYPRWTAGDWDSAQYPSATILLDYIDG